MIRRRSIAAGAEGAHVSEVWGKGGAGGEELARAVLAAAEKPKQLPLHLRGRLADQARRSRPSRPRSTAPTASTTCPLADQQIAKYTELGFGDLPICMAKTHLSISHDAALKGRPTDFRVPIREVRASMGAGFLYPLLGEMRTMPGLPSEPNTWKIDIDDDGNVVGLF